MTSENSRPVLVRSMSDAQVVLNRLADPTTKVLVYDIESTGLHWPTDYITGHVMTFGPAPQDTYWVPVRHGEAGASRDANIIPGHQYKGKKPEGGCQPHPFEIELDKIARARPDLHLIGHHLQFDLMFCYGHGIEFVGTMEDTQTNAALLNEHQHSFSLDNCCQIMGTTPKLGGELYVHLASKFGGEAGRPQMANFWRLEGDDPIGFDYAAGDGTATWFLRERQLASIINQELTNPWEMENGVLRVVNRMSKRGIRIDRDKLDDVIKEATGKANAALEKLPKDFNSRSGLDVQKLLTAHGVLDWPRKPPTALMIKKAEALGKEAVGNPEFNEAYLKKHEIGRAVLDVRKYTNICNSFAIPLRDRHIGLDGRVRATFHPMRADDFGTVTGRFSCSDPNLQQVPKRNYELAKLFRQVFVPDEDMLWGDADLSQCEPRLLAHYSGAKVLMAGYLATPHIDAHQAVATAADIDRDDGKRLNQTLITGGGLNGIIEQLGPRGKDVYDQYFAALPEIKTIQKNARNRLKSRGYIISLMGRHARLDDVRFAYRGLNRLLQCGNADLIKHMMIRIDRHYEENGDRVNLLNTVHDALSHQFRPDDKPIFDEAIRMMADYGPDKSFPLRVPMGVDYGIGKNWAEATFPEEKHYVQ